MKHKILVHKTLKGTYGVFSEYQGIHEIWQCHRPIYLFDEEMTIERLQEYWKDYKEILRELENYCLVDVELIIKN